MNSEAKLMNSNPGTSAYPAIRKPFLTTGTGNGGACYAIGSSQPAAAAAERGTANNLEHESPASKGLQRIAPQ
ncbi:MAG: hypothetical protein R2811_15030 [Flavobacteriales bacterium]